MVIPDPMVSVMLLALAINPSYVLLVNTTVPVPPNVWLPVLKEMWADWPSVAVSFNVRPFTTFILAPDAVRSRSQLAVTPLSVPPAHRSEEHTSELQSRQYLV